MGAAKAQSTREKAVAGKPGKLTFVCAGPEGSGVTGAAQVRARVAPPSKGRFLVVLSASSAFRGELRKALPKPLGRNRVILDSAPRKGGASSVSSEVDITRLAERAWFYRRLGATHLVVECTPPKAMDVRVYLTKLMVAFGPLATDDGLAIDLIVSAKAAAALHNRWLLSYLLGEANEQLGRELPERLLALKTDGGESFVVDGSEPGAPVQLPSLPVAGVEDRPEGQLGLL